MSVTLIHIRRVLLSLVIATMVLVAIPLPAAHADALSDSPTPAAPGAPGGPRLGLLWERLQIAHDRLGVMFDHVDWRLSRAQQLIDRAKANGKDVAAMQTALDAFSKAVQQARPIYESMQGIIASHQGFDANGQVTEISQAAGTVRDLAGKLREVRSLLSEPAKALREAVRTFRASNPSP